MNIKLKKKIDIVNETHKLSKSSISTTLVEYKKITSLEIKYLRQELYKNKLQIKVLKNTLAKKAFTNTKNESLITNIKGQIFIVFSETELSLPLSILNKFSIKNNNLKVKAICLYGKLFFANDINEIIKIPNKERAIFNLFSLLNLPLNNLIHTLKKPYLNLITLIKFKYNI